jgi:hypothetical protein
MDPGLPEEIFPSRTMWYEDEERSKEENEGGYTKQLSAECGPMPIALSLCQLLITVKMIEA